LKREEAEWRGKWSILCLSFFSKFVFLSRVVVVVAVVVVVVSSSFFPLTRAPDKLRFFLIN